MPVVLGRGETSPYAERGAIVTIAEATSVCSAASSASSEARKAFHPSNGEPLCAREGARTHGVRDGRPIISRDLAHFAELLGCFPNLTLPGRGANRE